MAILSPTPANRLLGVSYSAGAMRLVIDPAQPGRGWLRVSSPSKQAFPEIEVALVDGDRFMSLADAPASADIPVIVLYQGRRRHPQGLMAPVSWLNEAEGLITLSASRIVLHIVVTRTPPSKAIPAPERHRGRPNTSSLWLSATAIALPINLGRSQLLEAGKYSGFTVDAWIRQAIASGWIDVSSATNHARRFTVRTSGFDMLAELVQARWASWRAIGGVARRHFFSMGTLDRYAAVAQEAGQPFIPTGLSVLTERSQLPPRGSIREHAFITSEKAIAHMQQAGLMMLSDSAMAADGASEVTILDIEHPVFRIHRLRSRAERDPWPLGFAALDAMDHPDPRVTAEAGKAWEQWKEMQRITIASRWTVDETRR